jgi:hypothetical protein
MISVFDGAQRPPYARIPVATPLWRKRPADPTAAAVTPLIDTARIKDFLHLAPEDTTRDVELAWFLATAVAAVETYAQINLRLTRWTVTLPAFADHIQLNKRPFLQVDRVSYVAPVTGEVLAVPDTDWSAGQVEQLTGMLFRSDNATWPETARRYDAVELDVVSGFPDGTLPDEIVHALLMTVAAIDHNRGDCGCDAKPLRGGKNTPPPSVIPETARALLGPWRYVSLLIV